MAIAQTVRESIQRAATALAQDPQLRENATRDAQQLLETATGLTRAQTLAHPGQLLLSMQQDSLYALVARRLRYEPIQHLRGVQEFYGRSFRVTRDVLIPRPETEHIVEEFIALYPDRSAPLRIADVGTGSGVLAITLALEYTNARVTAVDISEAALAVARANAAHHGAEDICFERSDLLAALQDEAPFDVIVSNPPYIPLTERDGLHPQVRVHEPHLALFGGDDGLDVIRALLPQAARLLVRDGWLLLETAGRSRALDELLSGWRDMRYVADLQGIERIAAARPPLAAVNSRESV